MSGKPSFDLEVDVDLQEKKEGDTPLHLACRLEGEEDEERRNWIGEIHALQLSRLLCSLRHRLTDI